MYCIDCGTQNLDTTRYCKSCGADLAAIRTALVQPVTTANGTLVSQRHVVLVLILSGFVGVAGLGIVFFALAVLANILSTELGGGVFPLVLLLGAMGIFGVCFIVSNLLKMLRTTGIVPIQQPATGPLPQVRQPETPRQLNSTHFRQGVPSVVEHTTSRLGEYAPPPREEER
jgi:hypothetical protein